MFSSAKRSYEPELLDKDDIPFEDIRQNMRELNIVNSRLGGHKITIEAVKELLKQQSIPALSICEIGCGGGDNLAAIAQWCAKNEISVSFIGIDIKPACTAFAAEQYPGLAAKWITGDYKYANFENEKPHIIFSSLFCHHFREGELVTMMQWMNDNSRLGFFVNDLQRHTLAYFLIKCITSIFSRSYLVRNDAPLSVARAFKKDEWLQILRKAGINNFSVSWKWAFRYLVICKKNRDSAV